MRSVAPTMELNTSYPRLTPAMLFVGIGRPSEELRRLIGLGEEAVNGGLQVHNGSKDAAFQ